MTITIASTLFAVECIDCGVIFGVTDTYEKRRRGDHGTFHCPNGHPQFYPAKNEAEKLRDQLAAERRNAEKAEERWQREKASHAATKGQLTKTKKWVAGGVCPCCNRSFVQLARHMSGQHPEYDARSAR